MTAWIPAFAFVAYSLGAIACALSALWIARNGDALRNDRVPAVVALALTANWCFASASFAPGREIVQMSEIAGNLAWLFVLFRLFANDGRDETLSLVRPAAFALMFVESLQFLLVLVSQRFAVTSDLATTTFETVALFRIMVSVGALVLLHNLYVGAARSSRQILRWCTAALAGLWAFDLNYFTVAYITATVPLELSALRGIAAAVFAIAFAVGFNTRSANLQFRPSRAVTFRFLSLLVIGAYLGLMVALARSLDMLTGDLARMTQVGLIIAAGALALIWLPSARLRGWLRVTAIKHLFKHRYDYRSEWIRFTGTIGTTGFDSISLQARAVKALADIADSPAGILLVPDEDGILDLAENWQWETIKVPPGATSARLGSWLAESERILNLDEMRESVAREGEAEFVPDWMLLERQAWAAVPLIHFDRLVGLVVLARPMIERELDWEDYDLLSVVGRQLASYLAEQASQAVVLEASRFDEFNRRMAFVMHDIKNLSSQMGLLLRNAEKHADNPEFRKDMLLTLRKSVEKLNILLARLGRYGSPEAEVSREFDLTQLVRQMSDRFGQSHPVMILECEQVAVTGNREALEQALSHLVQNAIDASDPDCPVMVEVLRDHAFAVIHIIDSGVGMSSQFLRQGLFKPFVSSKSGGFGIGAFEARELIRAMDGRLDVESREGIGTRFVIRLPISASFDDCGPRDDNSISEVA